MATKNDTPASEPTGLIGVDQLKQIKNTPESVFCGVCAAESWRPGKSVSESEYDQAVKRFLNRPVGKAGY